MDRMFSLGRARSSLVLLSISAAAVPLLGIAFTTHAADPLSPDEQAAQSLNAARRAFNDGKFDAAAGQFREFLQKYGGNKEAASASYGLGVSLLELPQKDYPAAVEALTRASNAGDFADKALAQYYLGTASRGIGNKAMADAVARPGEAVQLKQTATARYDEAGRQFAAAFDTFTARAKAAPADAGLSDRDWAARARCDQADMLNRAGKFKEAADALALLESDAAWAKSPYRPLALYQLGYARFSLKDYPAAGRTLSQLAPFDQQFGLHTRYLLARVHHLSGDLPEAANQYQAVLTSYDEQKKAAPALLQTPANLTPDRKAGLEALVKDPAPDYLLRATFYSATLLEEQGKFADAADKFTAIAQPQAKSPLAAEAGLHLGFCKMQVKSFPDAVKALEPLREHPQLGDRAQWWLARCQIGAANPTDVAGYENAVRAATDALRRAADKAAQLAATDPDAKARRGDILLELADAQMLLKQYAEAANTYQRVLDENNNPDRAEEAMQRKVTALHLAGQLKPSDDLAAQFEAKYPKSTLLPAVLFRRAETAYLDALAATKDPARANNKAEIDRLFGLAVTRYDALVHKYPEFEYVNLAKQAMASADQRMGKYQEAIDLLTTIPDADRTGELATVPYLAADCLIRTFPARTDDALSASQSIDAAERAAKLLETFLSGNDKSPQAPDALLKLGHCYQQMGSLLADKDERQKALTKARETYNKAIDAYPDNPARPAQVLDRARCMALMGELPAATNELRRFQSDPLRSTPNAPLALIRLSALLRAQGQAPQAVDVMVKCRAELEAVVTKDPARADWAPMMIYEHALALKEAKKLPEARAQFEALVKQFADKSDGLNAVWQLAQCRREEAVEPLAKARTDANRPGAKPEEVAAAYKAVAAQLDGVRQAADAVSARVDGLAQTAPGSDPHLRMLYELAWCDRVLAQGEAEQARQKLAADALVKLRNRPTTQPADPKLPANVAAPEVVAAAVPIQPSEQKARDCYQRLIAAKPDAPLANQARFELAELLAGHGEHDAALDLLATALLSSPPPELADRIRLRVAASLLALNDGKAALAQVNGVAANANSPIAPDARYLAGECQIQQGDWSKAIDLLTPFRDQAPLQNLPGLSDRALLRLGYAYAQAGQWEPSRQACETVVQRFAQGPWAEEARYGMGVALVNLNRLDEAANTFTEVTHRTAAEVAARAQLQIGLCRVAQKRPEDAVKALLAVAYMYDYPEPSANAWYEAGRASLELKKTDDAVKSWQRVTKDYSATKWASLAKERLAEVK